ncbi:hypothetical protein ABZ131_20905 [Providencia rettgeri]
MKQYFLVVSTALLILFLMFVLAPMLFSAKNDLAVLASIVILLFVVPSIAVFSIKKYKTWSVKK